ncbi:MAG: hypothetical protein IBX55_15690 [Methyloprofundus sp.]|uniref:hypothetical protein n=1 Tax=Thiomicrospira sp. TaxID=935 RepID=UPI0019F00470|nr:hypothetical protein [Methyloprofundus sp.]
MRALRSVVLACCLGSSVSYAHDLGVVGTTFPIAEPSLFATIAVEMGRVNWDDINRNMAKKAREQFENLPYVNLHPANKDQLRLVDPTITLQDDITAPTTDGRLVYVGRKGQQVNPLDYTKPTTKMFFFDPSNDEQKKAALHLVSKHPTGVYLVAVGGNLAGLAEEVNRPIFYAYTWIIEKLNVRSYPSLVGTLGNRIAIAEIENLSLTNLERFWNEMD